ncbi:Phosphoesterase [Desulfurella amilsii]|uniref:Phosphoesterase n=2 Tax=Desulfurella amilsii TaxID=1562698 RepID=A0A1X4XVB8_9BACT|nr:metallophosphoesterase [Desulfurella amilsii]OSS41493.1 Phosphoesterase [Desulfurella amilsii]
MGFLILFVVFSVALLLFGIVYKPFLDRQINFTIACIISLSLIGFGYINAQKLHIRTITIKSKKIQKNTRVVFFSDLHAGLMINDRYVDKASKTINDLKPDLVIAGGDIIDSSIDGMEKSIEPLKKIKPIYGKYAVLGNHEFYRGINKCQTHLENVGFIVLRNNCVKINGFLNIAGIDDTTITNKKDREILSKCDKNTFIIFAKHRPLIENNDSYLFDLTVCGHTHAGQMFPFTLLTKAYYRNRDFGYFNINGSHLIISSGAGTWGPPFRIFSSSEIVLVNLEKLN